MFRTILKVGATSMKKIKGNWVYHRSKQTYHLFGCLNKIFSACSGEYFTRGSAIFTPFRKAYRVTTSLPSKRPLDQTFSGTSVALKARGISDPSRNCSGASSVNCRNSSFAFDSRLDSLTSSFFFVANNCGYALVLRAPLFLVTRNARAVERKPMN